MVLCAGISRCVLVNIAKEHVTSEYVELLGVKSLESVTNVG